jgi:hypothetical protein
MHMHDHSHGHDHIHSHDDTHGHGHGHVHSHEDSVDRAPTSADGITQKDLALLKYMLEHNREHAAELSVMGVRLADGGFEYAADMITDAVHYFEHASDSLTIAVDLVEGGL